MLIQPRLLVPFTWDRRVFRRYLLRVDFSTDDAAPVSSPYSGEIGSLTITDSSNIYSVSAGELIPSAASVETRDPWIRDTSGYSRTAGRTMFCRVMRSSSPGGSGNAPLVGWHNTLSNPNSPQTYGLLWLGAGGGSGAAVTPFGSMLIRDILGNDIYYRVAIVLRSSGFFLFVGDKLTWVDGVGTEATLYPGIMSRGVGTRPARVDYLRIRDLIGGFDTDYGIAPLHTSALNGSDYAAVANGIFDLAITAPASLAGEAGLKFRKNGGDYWKVNFDNSGDLVLQRYAADVAQGSPVTLATGVISGSATRRLRVITDGANMDVFTLSGSTWTQRGSTQTDSYLTANTGISPVADGSWTGGGGALGQLDAYERSSSLYDILDAI